MTDPHVRDRLVDRTARATTRSAPRSKTGRCEATKATAAPVPDFARRIDAANAIYGYRDREPFAQSFADERDYSKALADTPEELFDVELEFSA